MRRLFVFFTLIISILSFQIISCGSAGHSNTGEDPQTNQNLSDSDGDTIPDAVDNCLNVQNYTQADIDGDGIGDLCDDEMDGDVVLNSIDNCPEKPNSYHVFTTPPYYRQPDYDNDSIGDVCDPDADGDGVLNTEDNNNCFVDGPFVSCPWPQDSIRDVGEALSDWDGDGIRNYKDNCPIVSNTDQKDVNHDGVGDVCINAGSADYQDFDGDGILDVSDNCAFIINPDQTDSNQNGTGDACENN